MVSAASISGSPKHILLGLATVLLRIAFRVFRLGDAVLAVEHLCSECSHDCCHTIVLELCCRCGSSFESAFAVMSGVVAREM